MQFRTKNQKKTYYLCLVKATNNMIVSATKTFIARRLGIHVRTISRNMEKTDIYDTPEYTIWSNVPVHRAKPRGKSV